MQTLIILCVADVKWPCPSFVLKLHVFAFCLTLGLVCFVPVVQAAAGGKFAVISPDGRYALSDVHGAGQISLTTSLNPSKALETFNNPAYLVYINTPWSPDSRHFLTYNGRSLLLHSVKTSKVLQMTFPGPIAQASFSPNRQAVAFFTHDDKSNVNRIAQWRPSSNGYVAHPITKYDEPIAITWVDNSHLFLVQTVTGGAPLFTVIQRFYEVDLTSGKITRVLITQPVIVQQTLPYVNRWGNVLAMTTPGSSLYDSVESQREMLVEISPESGKQSLLDSMRVNFEGWGVVTSGNGQAYIARIATVSGSSRVLTWKIESIKAAHGPTVEWNAITYPRVDNSGRVFGYVGNAPGFAQVVKLDISLKTENSTNSQYLPSDTNVIQIFPTKRK
jgi:hypothetical protein